MTKEEVLQKVNDYCNEKSYTTETLTDVFKDKFADHFQKADPDGDIEDEAVQKSLKFALNTAFSSASELATAKATAFEEKENSYKTRIAELEKKVAKPKETKVEIPKEVQDKLEAYEKFVNEESKKSKFKNIVELAKKDIRQDLHASFEKFAANYEVELEKEDKEQAKKLTSQFQDIFRDSIGDIKPLAPRQQQQRDEELIMSLGKIKVQ
jgi:6-pyruvoyl-tetrahydropterin synthase